MVIADDRSRRAIAALQRPATVRYATAADDNISAVVMIPMIYCGIWIFDSYDNPRIFDNNDIIQNLLS